MNNTLKKGLISLAAASVVTTTAFAGSTVDSITAKTHYNDTTNGYFENNFTVPSIVVRESIGALSTQPKSLIITIPANSDIVDIRDGGRLLRSVIESNATLVLEANSTNAVQAAGAVTDAFVVLDANNSSDRNAKFRLFSVKLTSAANGLVSFNHTNTLTSQLLLATGAELNVSAAAGSWDSREQNVTDSIGTVTKNSDGTIDLKFTLKATDAVDENITIPNMQLLPIASTTTGAVNLITKGDDSTTFSTVTTKVGEYFNTPGIATITTSPLPNITAGTAQQLADFNVTFYDNVNDVTNGTTTGQDGNITVTLSAGSIESTSVNAPGTGSAITTGSLATGVMNWTTLGSQTSASLDITSTGVAVGTAIVATLTGDNNLTGFSQTLTLANLVADGATVELGVPSSTAATNKVLVGGSNQSVADINITEFFITSFASTDVLTLTLPTDYNFSTTEPTFTMTNGFTGAAAQAYSPSPAVVSGNTITYKVADTNTSTAFDANASKIQTVALSNIKISTPSSATAGDTVAISVSGTAVGSNTYSINVATLTSTNGTVESNITTAESIPFNGTTPDMAVTVIENVAGALAADKTITFTLSDGVFGAKEVATINTAGGLSLYSTTSTMSDDNKTITFTVLTPSSTSESNVTYTLDSPNLSGVSTAKTATVTMGGTAGLSGTFDLATLFDPANVTEASGAVKAIAKDADGTIGTFNLRETYVAGLLASKEFRIRANAGASFNTGAVSCTIGGVSATCTGVVSSANLVNDTMTITLPSTLSATTAQTLGVTLTDVHVKSDATDGSLLTFKILETATTSKASGVATVDALELVYVGSTLPTLTAAADASIEVGSTGSATVTASLGTVTYTSSDTDGNVTVDSAGLVTVASTATVGNTATITASDSKLGTTVTTLVTVAASTAVTTLSGDITIGTGWNLVSSPVDGTVNSSVLNAVAQKSGTTAVVWPANSTGSNYGDMGVAIDMAPGQGAWVLADTAGTASFTGITPATTAFSLATHVASLTAGGFGGGGYYLVGTPVATTFADVITAGAKIVWTFDTANNTYVGVNPAFAGQTGFDADGYYGGATSATAISAGSGFWYSAQ